MSGLPKYEELTPEQKMRLAKFAEDMFQSEKDEKELQTKSNTELAQLLLKHIWGEMDLFSYKATLLDVVIQRLQEPQ